MFQLVLLVVILIALAYMWNSTKPSGKTHFTSSGGDDPFKGSYTKPPPQPSSKTVDKGTMTRCHNCSTFFPERQVQREVVEGHILEFCSDSCKRSFIQATHH